MRLLLDTPVLLWWLQGAQDLPEMVATQIADRANEILVSAASIWEMGLKRELGRISYADDDLNRALEPADMSDLPLTRQHFQMAQQLPPHHDDVFDRLLIAQSRLDVCQLVTFDRQFKPYGVPVLRK